MSELEGLPTAGDVIASDFNRTHAELEGEDAARQDAKHMQRLAQVAKLVNTSGDKRRRPRGVTKSEFKKVRALKLTRPTRIKRKRQPKRR